MTEDEKFDADAKRVANKALKEKKIAWEATLVPWPSNENLRWDVGAIVGVAQRLFVSAILTLLNAA